MYREDQRRHCREQWGQWGFKPVFGGSQGSALGNCCNVKRWEWHGQACPSLKQSWKARSLCQISLFWKLVFPETLFIHSKPGIMQLVMPDLDTEGISKPAHICHFQVFWPQFACSFLVRWSGHFKAPPWPGASGTRSIKMSSPVSLDTCPHLSSWIGSEEMENQGPLPKVPQPFGLLHLLLVFLW